MKEKEEKNSEDCKQDWGIGKENRIVGGQVGEVERKKTERKGTMENEI